VFDLFEEWASTYDMTFKDDNKRMDALLQWKTNALKIQTHRKEHKSGKHTYQLGLTKFTHMTREEFQQTRLGYKNLNPTESHAKKVNSKKVKRATPPTTVDWVAGGLVTSVKDQGQCGCCWAFSAVATLEGAHAKAKGQLIDMSEEEFVDCVSPYIGCDGGVAAYAIDFVAAQKRMATAASYPYIAQDYDYNSNCEIKSAVNISMIPAYTWLDDDQSILAAVAIQPVSAAIAVGDPFQNYVSGVMDPSTACLDPNDINHAITVVGYGTDSATGTPYWYMKNSWASDWGENGYFRIARNVPNSCGITVEAFSVQMSYP